MSSVFSCSFVLFLSFFFLLLRVSVFLFLRAFLQILIFEIEVVLIGRCGIRDQLEFFFFFLLNS